MAQGLTDYLRAARDRDFVWGTWDCCVFALDWYRLQTGRDPMADLRGTYQTEIEAHATIAAHGGLEALFDARLTRSPSPLVGILTAPGQEPVGAISFGPRWVVLTPNGVASVNPAALCADVIGYR